MSSEYHFLFFPKAVQNTTSSLSSLFSLSFFEALACAVLLVTVFGLWLVPGGLAWALSKSKSRLRIPGPHGFPLTGMLTVFTSTAGTPHRALAELARRFNAGPLMAFSVGFTRFVISSKPETAKEILNSSAFADRPVKESAYELLFHRAMGFAPYGEYWRNLRRISATHLFSPKRIGDFGRFRQEIGLKMVDELKDSMAKKGVVEVKKVLHFGSLNNVMMTVFGRSYGFDEKDGIELEKMVSEGYELLGIFNWSDHFPLLGWLDLQGVRKRCGVLVSKVNAFVGRIIEEHRLNEEKVGDFVDVLLDLEKTGEKLSHSDMIAVLWEMIFRGTDTVAILLEWILARMILHPKIQSKAQAEIDSVTGNSKRSITDSDIPKLPYLRAIVRESLRVHPPGPLLSWARLAIHDVFIGQDFIPAGTTAMVNMWAITHDEEVWSEPEIFKPERFIEEESGNKDLSVMGSDLRLAPFGAGRRVCPGKALGLASVHLWLAQLLQNFNWLPCEDNISGAVDLSEQLKLSLEMKNPLLCRAVPRYS